MSDLLNIGASGVRAYQTALATTSDNIANASTAGYARRSATIEEVGRTTSVQLGQNIKLSGNGSRVSGITRAADDFKSAEVRSTGSDLARTAAGVTWLERIEGALSGNQLSQRLTSFFTAAKGVAADPAATAPRSVMLEDASALASAFGGTGRALDAAASDLAAQGSDAAQRLTDLAAGISRVNRSLTRTPANSSTNAELLDERDRLLEGMSALIDTNVSIDDMGRAIVRTGGVNGPVVADVADAAFFTFTAGSTGAVSLVASIGTNVVALSPSGGALSGLIDASARIAGARETLDALATDFTTAINQFQADGLNLSGAPGGPLFTIGASPTDIGMAITDPRGIAAAGVGEGARGNGNMAALAKLRLDKDWEGQFDETVTDNAALLTARRGVADAQGSIHTASIGARDMVTNVDLDEEAVNLIRFQQAYQASSRVIQVARDILQTIIDIR